MTGPIVLKPAELKPAVELCARALILLEGLPGLGKTALIRTLGRIL